MFMFWCKKMLNKTIFILLIIGCAYGSVTYKIKAEYPGHTQASFVISGESGDFTIELKWDDKVKLNVQNGGSIKSGSVDEKHYVLTGTVKSGETHNLDFDAAYDGNPGANLLSATFNGKHIDIGLVATVWPITIAPIGTKGHYDYGKAIHASLMFYEAQRSGKLPKDNRIHWRGDSFVDDGKDVGLDLSGGYHDAGDLVKFNFPMAYTMTVLSWGAADYADAYTKAGELDNVLKAIKWGTDYFIKCHTKDDELYGQVGNGGIDHAQWTRPEDWPKDKARPAYKITAAGGGSDLAGETAAAMAAASMAFKKSNPTYSATLLKHAKSLYEFADKYRETYTKEISDAAGYYKSWSGFGDELAWGAAWLLRATGDQHYKAEVEKHFQEFSKQLEGTPLQFGWDDKTAGVQTLMAEITGDEKYKAMTKAYCDFVVHKAPKSPKGMVYLDQWGPLRHAANVAFICLQAAKSGINAAEYRKFAESQIGYILGDTGRSFMVGVGVDPPQRAHHRAASCPTPPVLCDQSALQNPGPNPHILTGAMVGGPDQSDSYNDKRDDFVHNEVAMDYNAGLQSALAALLHLRGN